MFLFYNRDLDELLHQCIDKVFDFEFCNNSIEFFNQILFIGHKYAYEFGMHG